MELIPELSCKDLGIFISTKNTLSAISVLRSKLPSFLLIVLALMGTRYIFFISRDERTPCPWAWTSQAARYSSENWGRWCEGSILLLHLGVHWFWESVWLLSLRIHHKHISHHSLLWSIVIQGIRLMVILIEGQVIDEWIKSVGNKEFAFRWELLEKVTYRRRGAFGGIMGIDLVSAVAKEILTGECSP